MDEEYIFDGNITNEVIKEWAYDENMLLLEQDEDLIAGQREFFPALFDAIEDNKCPKREYALTIIDFYLMFQILRGGDDAISIVEEAITFCNRSLKPKVHDWKKLLEKRILYKKGIGPVNGDLALEMGKNLLNGICRSAEITILEEKKSEWVVQLSVPPLHLHKERIYIKKDTGIFRFER